MLLLTQMDFYLFPYGRNVLSYKVQPLNYAQWQARPSYCKLYELVGFFSKASARRRMMLGSWLLPGLILYRDSLRFK